MANATNTNGGGGGAYGPGTGLMLDPNTGQLIPDPNGGQSGGGGGTAPSAQAASGLWALPARQAATLPQYVHPEVFGYANLFDQMQNTMGMPSRYTQSWPWGNGAGRYAFGSGAPYGNPAGRNAPWFVTGDNGQAGQYPMPGTILGQTPNVPQMQFGGLLGQKSAPAGQPAQPGLLGGNTFDSNPLTPGAYTPGSGGQTGGGQALARMSPQDAAQHQGRQAQMDQNYQTGLAQWDQLANASDQQKADFLAHTNPQFTSQAVIRGKLTNAYINSLLAGGAPYSG